MGALELDAALRARVDTAPGGIDDRVVRATVRNVARHTVRELDHVALREYRKRAMNFHLDTRRPDPIVRRRTGEGSPGRRATLPELLAQRLQERTLPAGIERFCFRKFCCKRLGCADLFDMIAFDMDRVIFQDPIRGFPCDDVRVCNQHN